MTNFEWVELGFKAQRVTQKTKRRFMTMSGDPPQKLIRSFLETCWKVGKKWFKKNGLLRSRERSICHCGFGRSFATLDFNDI